MNEATSEAPVLPAIAASPVSIILLARDAQAHVEEVVTAWAEQLGRLNRPGELLLVNDGSTDRTAEIAKGLSGRIPSLRLLRHETRQGLGAALRTGLASVRHPLVFYTTCDRRFQPTDLRLLLAEIDKVHLVNGYRRYRPVPGLLRDLGALWRGLTRVIFSISGEPLPGWLGWKGHLHGLLVRIFFGVRLRDPGCLFCLLRRSILARIPVQADGSFAQDEVLAKANFLGCFMLDVPVSYRPPADSPWKEDLRHVLKDAYRVFSSPHFGPAVLPRGTEWSIP